MKDNHNNYNNYKQFKNNIIDYNHSILRYQPNTHQFSHK